MGWKTGNGRLVFFFLVPNFVGLGEGNPSADQLAPGLAHVIQSSEWLWGVGQAKLAVLSS